VFRGKGADFFGLLAQQLLYIKGTVDKG